MIKYKGKEYQGKHKPIVSEEVFGKVASLSKHNLSRKSNSTKTGIHNFILDKLVRCGHCGSAMSPRWAVSGGRRYFYYECTSVGHSGKEVCQVRQISAEALEDVVIERIRQISQNEFLLQSILKNKNEEMEKEIKELDTERIIL